MLTGPGCAARAKPTPCICLVLLISSSGKREASEGLKACFPTHHSLPETGSKINNASTFQALSCLL